ncbi:MAG TPA: alkaline phosphatase [Polyangia bacterium]
MVSVAMLLPAASGATAWAEAPAATPLPAPALVVATPAPSVTAAPGPPLARHVIIISEDGLRPDAMLRAHGAAMEAVLKRAAYSLTATTIRHASTLPAHAAMLSGFDEPAHKLTWNTWRPGRGFIQVPTIFDAATRAGQKSAAFVGKQKLEHIIPPSSGALFSHAGFLCHSVVDAAARYFVANRPQLEFVHFANPDEVGHHEGWMSEPQIQAIRETDHCLKTMIDAVHEAGLDGDTLFILSADHGGHGLNHTGRIKEDRLIPWIAWGVGVRAGHKIVAPISTMDTAATALWALGYPPPAAIEGRPVSEAFIINAFGN